MTTNTENPFKAGDTIDFCGDHFTVLANHGHAGTVKEVGSNGRTISPFYWTFQGEPCHKVVAG